MGRKVGVVSQKEGRGVQAGNTVRSCSRGCLKQLGDHVALSRAASRPRRASSLMSETGPLLPLHTEPTGDLTTNQCGETASKNLALCADLGSLSKSS